MNAADRSKANARLVRRILVIVVAMFGFGFAMVPLYSVFCELTGLNGKIQAESANAGEFSVDSSREISIEFVTSLNDGMPLAFRAESSKLKVHPGQYYTVQFFAENLTDHLLLGQAIPSIAPGPYAEYLQKTECFCFSEQAFEPHQERQMPVRFVIDPAIPEDATELTLSYTFFDITARKKN